MKYEFQPIGIIHSCFKEKFGIPRQPGLVPAAEGSLEILPPYNRSEAFRTLQDYSHLWLVFVFHAALREHWKPTVRPPRLGGNQRVGVFATRSPFRPNPLGLSRVELRAIDYSRQGVTLSLGGIDLLDQTPVLDIKPYLPYTDAIENASAGMASSCETRSIKLSYSDQAAGFLAGLDQRFAEQLRRLIRQVLQQDPRPAYLQNNPGRRCFGMQLYDYDIRWQVCGEELRVNSITPADKGSPEV
ncbi:MAG: tRNA (N6-threonylcarbamoyladenosine(37)-N6)-methyltransferase TrmO [Chromatiales bacterium]|jgi:tRNA-Thr(GGU) m(6)t(6)A37 methyltransferase TsaA